MIYHCHFEAAPHRNEARNGKEEGKKRQRRLLYLDFKREIASVAKFPA
jgi:hypothetical protein